MKKPILTAIASLALISGYGSENRAAAAPVSAPAATAISSAIAAPDLITGAKIYKSTCSICHKSGLRGAPRMGNKQDWESRLAQDKEILYDRAINGYRGKKGSMPSRGSNTKLSVDEVKAAVDYMIEHAIPSWSMENNATRRINAAHEIARPVLQLAEKNFYGAASAAPRLLRQELFQRRKKLLLLEPDMRRQEFAEIIQ